MLQIRNSYGFDEQRLIKNKILERGMTKKRRSLFEVVKDIWNNETFNEVVYKASLGLVIIWIILKLLRIIESPLWQEMLPFAGLVLGFITWSNRLESRLTSMEKDLQYIRKDTDSAKKEMEDTQHRLDRHHLY